ncbi:MAG: dihydroorotate dehydrogenase electron transfer subunit [Nitrososphaerales archaeon]
MRTIDEIRDSKIEKIVQESSNIRSLYFKDEMSLKAKPGQFIMVWLPGAGEFPMSVSLSRNNLASIGVKSMGEGSKKLYEASKGTKIGIRGPYGNYFLNSHKRILLVGGGTGMVPMLVAANALSRRSKATMIIAAKKKSELPFVQASKKILGAKNVLISTDDGSLGFKGYAHELVEEFLSKNKVDQILSCGPEKMMYQILQIANKKKVKIQFSLERVMKCGIGICGSCTIGEKVLCKDGAILDSSTLNQIEEFGRAHRNKAGTLADLKI